MHPVPRGRSNFAKIPVLFPVTRESSAETGSRYTASTTTQSCAGENLGGAVYVIELCPEPRHVDPAALAVALIAKLGQLHVLGAFQHRRAQRAVLRHMAE